MPKDEALGIVSIPPCWDGLRASGRRVRARFRAELIWRQEETHGATIWTKQELNYRGGLKAGV
jgi:hypothetical protein